MAKPVEIVVKLVGQEEVRSFFDEIKTRLIELEARCPAVVRRTRRPFMRHPKKQYVSYFK